jgi:hypothetical protein
MIGVITSEKSGSFERMGMKLYIWMRPGLIIIMPLTTCGYQLMIIWGIKWSSPGWKTWIDLTQCFYNLLTSPLFYPFLRCLYILRCQKIGLWRNCMWTFKVITFWLENGKFEFSRKQYIFFKTQYTRV